MSSHLRAVELEQLDRALGWPQRRKVEGEAAADHAVGLKHHEVELVGVECRRGGIGDDDVGAAALVGGLELVQLQRDARVGLCPGPASLGVASSAAGAR